MKNLAEKLGLGEGLTSTLVWIGTSVVLLLVVLVLAVWLVRMLRPSLNLGGSQSRGGRPQRLAITDAFSLDREGRKLVIVRRDNVEHLLLIGGPNDVLVEASIVRTERSSRDRPRSQGDADLIAAAETALAAELPRLDSTTAAEPQTLPPVLPPAPQPMAPPPKPQVSSLSSPPISKPHPAQPLDDEFENALAAMQAAQQRQQASARPAPPPAPPAPPLAADRFALPPIPAPQPIIPAPPVEEFAPAPVVAPAPPLAPAPPALEPVAPKQPPMSEMARRLNEVLQKPLSGTLRPPFNKSIPPVPPTPAAPKPAEHKPVEPIVDLPPLAPAPPPVAPIPELPPPPVPAAKAEPAPAPLPSKSTDIEMDLLEEEMARLLGRPQPPSGSGS